MSVGRKRERIDFLPVGRVANGHGTENDERRAPSTSTATTLDEYSIEPSTNAADKVSAAIQSDKEECCRIIEQFGVDKNELLHLLGEWTRQLIINFRNQREKFKITLKDKWETGELDSLKMDEYLNRKILLAEREKLMRWMEENNGPTTNGEAMEKLLSLKNLKELVERSIDELLEIIAAVRHIHQSYADELHPDPTKIIVSNSSFNETIVHLQQIQEINRKEFNTICIIGLEKAGKSSFINALVGFELLPYRIERCTQIQTVLKPIDSRRADLYSTIEFYDENEFQRLIEQMPRKENEDDESFRQRLHRIRQTREKILPQNSLLQQFFAANELERKRLTEKLHGFIAEEIYLTIIKDVTIYTDRLPGANYILLDVPGCDSPIREHYQSALDAIGKADAFLFLTDGLRPSLTKPQLDLLDQIQRQHFDGMKRAFGIITKLDLCQTSSRFKEHQQTTRRELKDKHFLDEHIFTVAANLSLLEETKSNPEELRIVTERISSYDSLIDGFQLCKNALNRFIEHQLPYARYRSVQQIQQQKVLPFVREALALTEEMLPMGNKGISIDDYLRQINSERWNEIFESMRFQPTQARAIRWQRQTLAIERQQTAETLQKYFATRFRSHCQTFLKEVHPVRDLMLEKFDLNPIQMDALEIDIKQREDLVLKLFHIVQSSSNDLATFMFEKYVQQLEQLLNQISPEIGNLFQSFTTLQQCAHELKSLIVRSTHPLIFAVLHKPHLLREVRRESTKEFIRLSPLIAFNLFDSQSRLTNPNEKFLLTKMIEEILEEIRSNTEEKEPLFAIFRR